MPRNVVIPVDDPKVASLEVKAWTRRGGGELRYHDFDVPVPQDDQLTRDVEDAVGSPMWEAASYRHKAADEPVPDRARHMSQKADLLDASAGRLRAFFHLDTEDGQ